MQVERNIIMPTQLPYETYGFRFNNYSNLHLPLCHLFAVGHDNITHDNYRWHGLERQDGPLLLFQYTLNGSGQLDIGQQRMKIQKHQAFLTEIPSDHCYYYDPEQEGWNFYFILIRPHTILPFWNEIVQFLGRIPSLPPTSKPIQILEEIISAAQAGLITDEYIASTYVYSFVIELRKYAESSPIPKKLPDSITSAVQYIDKHYQNMIGQEQLANQLGLSKYQFIRSFTKYMGITPNDYLNRKKIENSLTLLLSTNHSLEYIAQEVGYSSASYYIRVFRKLIGQTPASFRSSKHQLQYDKLYFN